MYQGDEPRAWIGEEVQVLGQCGLDRGQVLHAKRLALSDVDLAGDQAEGSLYNLRNMLALARWCRGAHVIDISLEGDAATIQCTQQDLKNNNK